MIINQSLQILINLKSQNNNTAVLFHQTFSTVLMHTNTFQRMLQE